jgi:hypothetical protein
MQAQKFAKTEDNKNHASKTIQWLLTCLASSPIFTNKKQAYWPCWKWSDELINISSKLENGRERHAVGGLDNKD